MTLEDVINAYERMKEHTGFVYWYGFYPLDNSPGFYNLLFMNKSDHHYRSRSFEYWFDTEKGWISDEMEYTGPDLACSLFSIPSVGYIYVFLINLMIYITNSKYDNDKIKEFIDYLEKERKKES